MKLLRPARGEHGGATNIMQAVHDTWQIAGNPQQGFPNQSKIVIACMGIDDNWTNSDEVYTAGSRTDTLFLLTLDLANKKATMLSIPRDSFVPIAGANYSSKINAAFATGGPARSEATIRNWLNVSPDYYMVLNIDATKKLVDALGGVDLNVEHQMDYDDEWGHLHVHLKPGFQHLDGDNAVAFARFRHANHGVTPEDGDERRMYRQHILLRAMMDKAKSFSSVLDANNLVDTGMSCIRTDLTRTQLFDLAAIFHSVSQDDVITASLPGEDARGPNGAYIMKIDDRTAGLYTDWLVRGDDSAGRALTPVQVVNTTRVSGLAAKALEAIKSAGFSNAAVAAVPGKAPASQTVFIDGGVADHQAVSDVAMTLGIANPTIVRDAVKPNRFGWAPPAAIRVQLGSDFVKAAQQPAAASAI